MAIHAVLGQITQDGHVVMLVDDIQWVDPASAGALAYLARRIGGMASLLITAARSGEPLEGPVSELVGQATTRVELEPLTATTIENLMTEDRDAEEIIRRTLGVPLLVIEALSNEATSAGSPGVVRYMETRLRDVSDLGRQILGTAAVLNGVCDSSLIRETSGRREGSRRGGGGAGSCRTSSRGAGQ